MGRSRNEFCQDLTAHRKAIEETLEIYDYREMPSARDQLRKMLQRTIREWPLCPLTGEPLAATPKGDRQLNGRVVVRLEWHCSACYAERVADLWRK